MKGSCNVILKPTTKHGPVESFLQSSCYERIVLFWNLPQSTALWRASCRVPAMKGLCYFETYHKARPCGELLAEFLLWKDPVMLFWNLPQSTALWRASCRVPAMKGLCYVETYHKARPCGELLAEFHFPQTQVGAHVVVGGLVAHPPPHVHHLELVALLLAECLQVGVGLLHQRVSLVKRVCK